MAKGLWRDEKRALMQALLTLAAGRTRFLASPAEITALSPGRALGEDALERDLAALSEGGYVDVVSTDRKGERTYVVELTKRGEGYFREARVRRQRLALRIVVAALCGAASALAGVLLKMLFS